MNRRDNSNIVEGSSQSSANKMTIRSMPDPDDIYSSTLGAADVSNSTVHVPNVRDGDGNIIPPDEYEKKLEHGSIVTMNVYFKLSVFSKTLLSNDLFLISQVEFKTNLPK